MKRITVSVTIEDDGQHDAAVRWMKNEMISATMAHISKSALDVLSIEAKVGTPRKGKT